MIMAQHAVQKVQWWRQVNGKISGKTINCVTPYRSPPLGTCFDQNERARRYLAFVLSLLSVCTKTRSERVNIRKSNAEKGERDGRFW